MNQILFELSSQGRYLSAGGGYSFDASFATSLAGYPKGAVIPNSTASGYWLNTVDDNSTNPENTTAALTGWVPVDSYGATTISGLAATSLTLTTLQASKDRIKLSGTLTANINIVLPAWVKNWTIVNGCTGSFSVTVKTPSGTGVSIPTGMTAGVFGDGVNIVQDGSFLGISGRLNGSPVIITASGNYTPKPGTTSILVYAVGGGGGGGGTVAVSQGSASAGGGGGGGGLAVGYFNSGFNNVSVTIGNGGVGNLGAAGSAGSATIFGSLMSAGGGSAGAGGGSVSSTYFYSNGQGGSVFSGSLVYNKKGFPGTIGQVFNASTALGGSGGPSEYGQGGQNTGATAVGNYFFGAAPVGYGAGGGGGVACGGSPATKGGDGSNGCIVIWEYL
jgi:hypothetical protein